MQIPDSIRSLTAYLFLPDAWDRAVIEEALDEHAAFEVQAVGDVGTDALGALQERVPDLLVVDARLRGPDAFQLVDRAHALGDTQCVVVSADPADAGRAYQAHAVELLPSPCEAACVRAALDRVRDRAERQGAARNWERLTAIFGAAGGDGGDLRPTVGVPEPPRSLERLIVRRGRRFLFLRADQIDWIEAKGIYVSIHTGERTYLVRERMKTFEERLDSQRFMRIHRSSIVNLNHVKEIVPRPKGGAVVQLQGGAKLPMSRSYVNRLDRMLASPPPRTQVL